MSEGNLTIKSLEAGYGSVVMLREVNMSFHPGTATLVRGLNGTGKSTLLKAIIGSAHVFSGSIYYGDERINALAPHSRVLKGICHVAQQKGVFRSLTVEENLHLGKPPAKFRGAEMEHIYDVFPFLKEKRHHFAGFLSGGEQQTLRIARAMLAQPKVLLLDEPSSGLSDGVLALLKEFLKRMRDLGTIILIVEQRLDLFVDLADSLALVSDGGVRLERHPTLQPLGCKPAS
jgi:branched-chain amino acid transport system ATP-binding protein